MRVIIPHGRPETTFDIKYFPRERRRVHEAAVNTGPRREYSVDPRAEALLVGAPPAPGVRAGAQSWRKVSVLHDTNNGYT